MVLDKPAVPQWLQGWWTPVPGAPTGWRRAKARRAPRSMPGWVVQPDDTCVIRIARSEMEQGTLTGLAQLGVEELECDWK